MSNIVITDEGIPDDEMFLDIIFGGNILDGKERDNLDSLMADSTYLKATVQDNLHDQAIHVVIDIKTRPDAPQCVQVILNSGNYDQYTMWDVTNHVMAYIWQTLFGDQAIQNPINAMIEGTADDQYPTYCVDRIWNTDKQWDPEDTDIMLSTTYPGIMDIAYKHILERVFEWEHYHCDAIVAGVAIGYRITDAGGNVVQTEHMTVSVNDPHIRRYADGSLSLASV